MASIPTPPASEVGDAGDVQDDCVGCKRIREIEAFKYEHKYHMGKSNL